jgi:UDP-N-acetylmuramoyl-tripeptide--D-alanyl-D-alanine ligase
MLLSKLLKRYLYHPVKNFIAKYYLIFLQTFFGVKVIAVTGSAGKTTTKEMLASILKQRGKTVSSFANIDPVYNIPSTILRCTPATKYLVLEMGIEYKGEMDFYLWLAKPFIGIITNIYPSHTLFLDNIKGVAKEKIKLVYALSKTDYAVLNRGSKLLKKYSNKIAAKIVWFGENTQNSIRKYNITSDYKSKLKMDIKGKEIAVTIPIAGRQFAYNALAASITASVLGCSSDEIKQGLSKYILMPHRMSIFSHKSGAVIIDDTYNNNPQAAMASLETLQEIKGKRKVGIVFGDMLELGKKEKQYHKEVVKKIMSLKPKFFIGVGNVMKAVAAANWVGSRQEVVKVLLPKLDRSTIVLVKGSRSIGLDHVITQLQK